MKVLALSYLCTICLVSYTELSGVGGQHTQALCTVPGPGRPRIFQMASEMKYEIPIL